MASLEPNNAKRKISPLLGPRKPRVLLAASGSVAAVKFGNICRSFAEWADIRAVVTKASLYFIDCASLSRDVVFYMDDDEWSSWNKIGDPVLHIELRKWADMMVVAPLSANTLAKIAGGLSDNLLTCIVRAWDYDKPIFVAPSMNKFMWKNPFTERHLVSIDELGIGLISSGPEQLAFPDCGIFPDYRNFPDYGNGTMAEPSFIFSTVRLFFEARRRRNANNTQ